MPTAKAESAQSRLIWGSLALVMGFELLITGRCGSKASQSSREGWRSDLGHTQAAV
jgi:hypothetical protein